MSKEQINNNTQTRLINTLFNTKQTNKTLYDHQVNDEDKCDIKAQSKWEKELEDSEINWKNTYQNIF